MLKKTNYFALIFLFTGLLGLFLSGCSSSKPAAGEESDPMSATEASSDQDSKLEESKQEAESAEWEAHRLREELYRKKNADQ